MCNICAHTQKVKFVQKMHVIKMMLMHDKQVRNVAYEEWQQAGHGDNGNT